MTIFGKVFSIGAMVFLGLIVMASTVHGYLIHEIEPGILEMRGVQDGSLEIRKVYIDKQKRWVYFEVLEARPMSRGPAGLLDPVKDEVRYFYAPYSEARLNKSKRLRFIQYGIGQRVFNSKGKIPFGSQKFFYPVVYFQTLS
jgi:hypothetical protein